MTGLSESQLKALAITPKITAAPSIVCSVLIIKEVISDHRKGKGKATARALLGMTVIDLFASSGWFLSTWAAPRGTPVAFATGNTQSCTYQGFLLQIAVGAPMYNASLALFYLLTIRNGWPEQDLKRIEKWIHAFIVTFALGTAIALIPLNTYNNVGAVCWTMGLPQGCGNSNHTPSDVPCERGNHAWIYGLALFYIPLWVCIAFTSVAMALIYFSVRETEKRNLRYAGARASSRRQTFIQTNRIMTQALLYSFAFYITWTPSTIWSIVHWFDKPMFWLDLLACICEPSQGSLNFLVYIFPRPELRNRLKRQFCCCFGCETDGRRGSSTLLSSWRSQLITSRISQRDMTRIDKEHRKDDNTKGLSIRDSATEIHVYEEAPKTAETEEPPLDFIPEGI